MTLTTSDVDRYLTSAPSELLRPHVILPAQHFNPPQKHAPEQELMMAVLEDAVRCIEKYRFPTDGRGRRIFLAAQQWLLTSEPHWPYSFECICAALDIDAGAVLHRLRLAPQRPASSVAGAIPARRVGAPRRTGTTPTARGAMRMVGAREMESGRP